MTRIERIAQWLRAALPAWDIQTARVYAKALHAAGLTLVQITDLERREKLLWSCLAHSAGELPPGLKEDLRAELEGPKS